MRFIHPSQLYLFNKVKKLFPMSIFIFLKFSKYFWKYTWYNKRTEAEQVLLRESTSPTMLGTHFVLSALRGNGLNFVLLVLCVLYNFNSQNASCNSRFAGYCIHLTSTPPDISQFLLTNVPLFECSNSYPYRKKWHYVLKFMIGFSCLS